MLPPGFPAENGHRHRRLPLRPPLSRLEEEAMGNRPSTSPTPQEQHEAAVRAFVSESVGRAARSAFSTALHRAQAESSTASDSLVDKQNQEFVPTSGLQYDAVKDSLICDVLPVVDAARAAAEATIASIRLLEPSLRPASLSCSGLEFTRYKSKLSALEASAATTATTCVYTIAAVCAAKKERGESFSADLEFIQSVVSSTVQASCSSTLSGKQPTIPANKWVAILAPLLAACLPTASAAYPHFAKSSPGIVLGIYGGLFVLIITLMIGVAAVPFRSKSSPESISRHAAFLSFLLLAAIGTVVMCTLLPPWGLRAVPIGVGSLSAIAIVTLWYFSGEHYR